MKKQIPLLLAMLVLLVSLSGCTKEDSNSSQTSTIQKNIGESESSTTRKTNEQALKQLAKEEKETVAKKEMTPKNSNQQQMEMSKPPSEPREDLSLQEKYNAAILKTSRGEIEVEFLNKKAPKTVNNFLKLSSENFYDGVRFHRVIDGFMIQTGDPNSKNKNQPETWGTGGPGYEFEDEFNDEKLVRGSLAMANSGPNTNGSQFFIVTAKSTPHLDGKHTNFGFVTKGMDVVDKIVKSETNENDQPLEDVFINSVKFIKADSE